MAALRIGNICCLFLSLNSCLAQQNHGHWKTLHYGDGTYYEKQIVYGKYYAPNTITGDDHSMIENSYFIRTAKKESGRSSPTVIFLPGNHWHPTSEAENFEPYMASYLSSGYVHVSIGYRAIFASYSYDDNGIKKDEELIHVDPEGKLSLDSTGRTMKDYKVRACWMELIMKPLYDTAQAMDHLIAHADQHGIDPHRIFFVASSAGATEVNYLTWVYHRWNKERFTPLGMLLTNPVFDLPINCMMGPILKHYIDHADAGSDVLVKTIMTKNICFVYLGCYVSGYLTKEFRNMSWDESANKRFCDSGFDELSVGDVYKTQKYAVALGMEKLWYVSQNMLDHQPKPFYLYVESTDLNPTNPFPPHDPLNGLLYAEMAERVGINYTAIYTEQPGLSKSTVPGLVDKTRTYHYGKDGNHVRYMSSVAFPPIQKMLDGDEAPFVTHFKYISYVFGLSDPSNQPSTFAWARARARAFDSDMWHVARKMTPSMDIIPVGIVIVGLLALSSLCIRHKMISAAKTLPSVEAPTHQLYTGSETYSLMALQRPGVE